MGFVLLSVENPEAGFCNCVVRHSDNKLNAKISGDILELDLIVGKTINAELGYDNVVAAVILPYNNDKRSGIVALEDINYIAIIGRIINIFEANEDFLIDIYVQDGAEFILVYLSELDIEKPEVYSMIRIVVNELKIFPTSIY